jgi:hypothetical protein
MNSHDPEISRPKHIKHVDSNQQLHEKNGTDRDGYEARSVTHVLLVRFVISS